MRMIVLSALLAMSSWTLVGCGEGSSSSTPPSDPATAQAEREKRYPGVPTEGPEAPKVKATKKK